MKNNFVYEEIIVKRNKKKHKPKQNKKQIKNKTCWSSRGRPWTLIRTSKHKAYGSLLNDVKTTEKLINKECQSGNLPPDFHLWWEIINGLILLSQQTFLTEHWEWHDGKYAEHHKWVGGVMQSSGKMGIIIIENGPVPIEMFYGINAFIML